MKIYLAKDCGWPGEDTRLILFDEINPKTGEGISKGFAKDVLGNLYTTEIDEALRKQLSKVP